MTPMHPKLRTALQREIQRATKKSTTKALTTKVAPNLWLQFEDLITKRFYLEKYQPQKAASKIGTPGGSSQAVSIQNAIASFQIDYLPNYKKIQQKWLRSQQRQLKRNPFSLNPLSIIWNSVVLLGKWILSTIFRRFHWRTMPDVQMKE